MNHSCYARACQCIVLGSAPRSVMMPTTASSCADFMVVASVGARSIFEGSKTSNEPTLPRVICEAQQEGCERTSGVFRRVWLGNQQCSRHQT